MMNVSDKIQEIARRLLEDGKVDKIIGYCKGTLPMMSVPCMIRKPGDCGRLVWDSHCRLNLATYLENDRERIGIVAKGCDSRNIVTHLLENRIQREQLTIIGVPCDGMTDKVKLADLVDGEITGVVETDGIITVKTGSTEKSISRNEVLQDNCALCHYHNPVIYDVLAKEPVKERKEEVNSPAAIRNIEAMTPDARWRFFEDMLSPCTRCYACRNACPLCYCPVCFVDESRPQWVGKGMDHINIRAYHFLRAFHCAGRCTDCGACEAACPMNIPIRLLTGKLEKECREQFGWTAGILPDQRPALDTYTPNDPNEFIK
jgi:formate dehydrogenase (coenzyme F420) beta subunit